MSTEPIDRLTDRERECLRLVSQGFNTKEIARRIGSSDHRAAKIIDAANRKLGVSSRMQAARLLAAHEDRRVYVIPGIAPPLPPPADRQASMLPHEEAEQPVGIREDRLPFRHAEEAPEFQWPLRRRGSRQNDLSGWYRLTWLAILISIALLGVGVLARGIGSLSDQIILVPSEGR